MVLFLDASIYELYRLGSVSTSPFAFWVMVLIVCVFLIVGSRVYTGTRGFANCSAGIILEVINWLLQHLVMSEVEKWTLNSGWSCKSLFLRGDTLSSPLQRP